ncbi:MAG: phosphatidate cytidylyltransferase [Slackia sp.]|nr:phosphatidate cytidylyltransferase [Slackia sp.]
MKEHAHQAYASAKSTVVDKKNAAKKFVYEKTPDKFKNASDLQVRFRTGFVYVSVSMLCVLTSEITTVLLLCVLSGIAAAEFFYMLRSDAKLPNELLGILAAIAYPVSVWQFGLAGALIVTGTLLVALLVWYVFWSRARIGDVGVSFFGAAYTGLLLSSLIVVRQAVPGFWGGVLVVGVFCSVWANDSFAYLVGSKFGKHKLAPRISPKKSWEGFFGGLAGSVVIWLAMSYIPGVEISLAQAVLFGMVCGLAGVLGDLAESRIKRNSGVKDSGTIMPGHGGILDRCDSLFLASVVSAVLMVAGGCIPSVL